MLAGEAEDAVGAERGEGFDDEVAAVAGGQGATGVRAHQGLSVGVVGGDASGEAEQGGPREVLGAAVLEVGGGVVAGEPAGGQFADPGGGQDDRPSGQWSSAGTAAAGVLRSGSASSSPARRRRHRSRTAASVGRVRRLVATYAARLTARP